MNIVFTINSSKSFWEKLTNFPIVVSIVVAKQDLFIFVGFAFALNSNWLNYWENYRQL